MSIVAGATVHNVVKLVRGDLVLAGKLVQGVPYNTLGVVQHGMDDEGGPLVAWASGKVTRIVNGDVARPAYPPLRVPMLPLT